MQRIEVNGIKVYAFHGCLPEESVIGGNYIVDLFVDTDFTASMQSDALIDTVDYVVLNKIVEEEMAIRSKLIEHVARRINERVLQTDARVERVGVSVRKLLPPINGDVEEVVVKLEMRRSH
jgi:dihydroneopterin aldolase